MREGAELHGLGGGLIPGGGGPRNRGHKISSQWVLIGCSVTVATAHLSSQEGGASCQEGASPSERHDPEREASPLEDPSGAACQGAGPSYLQVKSQSW